METNAHPFLCSLLIQAVLSGCSVAPPGQPSGSSMVLPSSATGWVQSEEGFQLVDRKGQVSRKLKAPVFEPGRVLRPRGRFAVLDSCGRSLLVYDNSQPGANTFQLLDSNGERLWERAMVDGPAGVHFSGDCRRALLVEASNLNCDPVHEPSSKCFKSIVILSSEGIELTKFGPLGTITPMEFSPNGNYAVTFVTVHELPERSEPETHLLINLPAGTITEEREHGLGQVTISDEGIIEFERAAAPPKRIDIRE